MALPIKDKNEIIVFFSTDIMRERSPVTKNGYKEGYLTKRGKNFGGWKTRYFVLQGPVLEYYESVRVLILIVKCRFEQASTSSGVAHTWVLYLLLALRSVDSNGQETKGTLMMRMTSVTLS